MTKKTKYIVGLAIVLLLGVGVFVNNRVVADGGTISEFFDGNLGAVSTLDGVDNPYTMINGQKTWYGTIGMSATSSVLCAIQNPYGNGTSSVLSLSAESTSNPFTDHFLYVSTSTISYGSSTPAWVAAFPMGTRAQWSLELEKNSATTTAADVDGSTMQASLMPGRTNTGASRYILRPGEWLTWRVATTTPVTLDSYSVGQCSAVFKKI